MPSRFRLLFATILVILTGTTAWADMVVVVNTRAGVDTLSRGDAVNIFLGRYRQLPSGIPAYPIDQPDGSTEKARFYRLLVDKDIAEIGAYWTRLVFSGKTSPPRQARDAHEVMNLLANHPGGVAYLDRAQTDARVRIVLELER